MKNMKKRLLALAALACLLAVTAFAAGIPAVPAGSCVRDDANVLSAATEQKVNELTVALDEACGAQIAVLTVDFTGTLDMEDYAYQVFDSWGVGDKKKNNGVLLLLVIGDENYYCTVGTGLEKELPPSRIDALLYDNLEEGFAAGDYDRGVAAFAEAMFTELAGIYNVQPSVGGGAQGYEPPRRSGFGMGTALLVILVSAVLVVLIVVSSALHPVRYVRTRYFGYVYPPRPPRRWHRSYHRPPPPGYGPGPYGGPHEHGPYGGPHGPGPRPPQPPHTGGGFGGFGGGSSGPSRPSGSSGGSSFKGFGGGSSRGAGAGRRSSPSGGSRPSGGSKPSGGGRSSGGAGRRK